MKSGVTVSKKRVLWRQLRKSCIQSAEQACTPLTRDQVNQVVVHVGEARLFGQLDHLVCGLQLELQGGVQVEQVRD